MLTLVEPCIVGSLLDRPDLGCAMLIAACQEKGIKTTLTKGQTRYLKDTFVNDSEELWNLIQDLKEDDLKKIDIAEYKNSIQPKGIRQFQDELKNLYQYVIVEKNPRHYFNGQAVKKFDNLNAIFGIIYYYYLMELNHGRLKIIERYVSEIIKSNPRYIGFSLLEFEPLSRTIRKRIKEMAEIPIVVGGAITPFINLKKLDKTFKEEYFDYLVVGSGEDALPSLIEALDNNIEPKGIANVFYTKDGKVKSNDLEAINNLDILPYPDFSQFDLDLYLTPKRVLPLQTARGCTWRKCAFCSYHNTYLGSYKTFSIKRVIETIKYLQSMYECSHFEFHDDEFPPGRAKSISEAILNTDLEHIYISMYSRPVDGYNNNNLLRLMRKAGFSLIRWGIESGCQKTLELMKKGTKISTMSQILRKSSENKIANLCFILFGFPGESEKEAQQTIEFLKTHADYIEDIILSVFIMQPYSPIGKNPERWSVDIKKDGTYSTKSGMDYEEVNDFIFKFDKEAMIDSVKITSDKIRYLLPGHNRAFSYFFISGYNLLSNKDLMKCLGERRFNKIFPIILGEVKKINGKTVLLPVNIKKNIFINVSHPEKEKALDRFQEKLFILSDGTLSIENIISAVYKGFKKEKEHRKKYIHKKCTDFFQDIFSKNWGLGFEKSWHRF